MAIAGDVIYDLKTVFGFFPDVALKNQVGLPVGTELQAGLNSQQSRFDCCSVVLCWFSQVGRSDAVYDRSHYGYNQLGGQRSWMDSGRKR